MEKNAQVVNTNNSAAPIHIRSAGGDDSGISKQNKSEITQNQYRVNDPHKLNARETPVFLASERAFRPASRFKKSL